MEAACLFVAREVEGKLEVELNEATLTQLQASFPASPLTVVLALGDSLQGKSQTLDSLLGRLPHNSISSAPFQSFARAEGGVSVYPHPVTLGSKTLLLMECEGVGWSQGSRNPAELEGVWSKLAFLELELTSVWLFFAEKGSLFPRLRMLSGLSPVQLSLIFAEEKALTRTKQQWDQLLAFLTTHDDNSKSYQFVFRGIGEVDEEGLTQTLKAIEDSGPESKTSIQEWVSELRMLVDLAGHPEPFEQFREAVEQCRASGSMQQVNAARRDRLLAESIQAVPLFHSSDLRSTLVPEIGKWLSARMDLTSPAVVLLTLGKPGLGKSTFLNFLWQSLTRTAATPFAAGSTCTHTTTGCQIGNVAARMPGSDRQVVLMDMEGVEGTEENRVEEAGKQSGLVNEAVKLASVVCILIENTLVHLELVFRLIHRVYLRNLELGFLVERIILLFHDKDFLRAGKNQEFEERVSWVNWRYFGGREVVVILNKPSLVRKDDWEQVEQFLQNFLALADVPKRTVTGCELSLQDVFASFALTSETDTGVLAGEEGSVLAGVAANVAVNSPYLSLTSLFCSSRLCFLSSTPLHLLPLLAQLSDSHLFSLLSIDSCYTALLEASQCRDLNLRQTCQLLQKNALQLELSDKLERLRSKYAPELLGFLDAPGQGDGRSAVIWSPADSLLTRKGVFDATKVLNPNLKLKPVPSLLIVLAGTADVSAGILANQLAHTLVPLTPYKTDCFLSKEPIQGLAIPLPHANLKSHQLVRCQVLVVVVTIPENGKDRERVGNLAWKLLEKAQVRVLMMGRKCQSRLQLETLGVAVLDRPEEEGHGLAYRSQRTIVIVPKEEREQGRWTQSRSIPDVMDSPDSFETLCGLREAVRLATVQPYPQFLADLEAVVKEANGS